MQQRHFVAFFQQAADVYLLPSNVSCLLNIFIFCYVSFLPFLSYLLWLWDVDHVNIRSLICMLHRSQALPLAAIIMSSGYIITKNLVFVFVSFLFKYLEHVELIYWGLWLHGSSKHYICIWTDINIVFFVVVHLILYCVFLLNMRQICLWFCKTCYYSVDSMIIWSWKKEQQ